MPERGGSTTQSGILYQNAVAALYIGRLCDARQRPINERVTSVWPEATEPVDDLVVEFADGHTAYYQAKENIDSSGDEWRTLWQHCSEQYKKQESFKQGRDRIVLLIGSRAQRHAVLRDLCARAAATESYSAWMQRATTPQKTLLEKITPHLELLGDIDRHRFFQHLEVHLWPLDDIERDLIVGWIPESTAPTANVFAVLRDYAGQMGRQRKRITAPALVSFLHEQHDIRFQCVPETGVLTAAFRACGGLLRQQVHTIAGTGRHIDRSIVHDIIEWIDTDITRERVALLLDQAGVGKTVVMHDVLLALEDQGIPVLAIKADQQLSGVTRQTDLHTRLGLPMPVDEAVAVLATQGRVVVLIDQVDALSLSLARDQDALNVVLDLVGRLRLNPAVRIVLSCRSFDRDNDPRLRRVEVPKIFPLAVLTDDEITAALCDMGVTFDTLHPATQRLLRTPLHLDLFGRIVERHRGERAPLHAGDLNLTSLQSLYALLWRDIILVADAAAPPPEERVPVIRVITERMNRDQRVAVPQTLFTTPENVPLQRALGWLLSTGIIVRGATEYAFFHQTFFDYCYARDFVERGGRLTQTIIASDQGLFARPQLVQVLAYMRGTNPLAYHQELRALLAATTLRQHLRVHLFRWVGALPNPTANEWQIVRPLLHREDTRLLLLTALMGNAAWFSFLRGSTLDTLLNLDPLIAQREVVPYLRSIMEVAPRDVSLILRPFVGTSEQWNHWIHHILYGVRTWEELEVVALYEALVEAAPQLSRETLHDLARIAQTRPEEACRILYNLLTQQLDEYIARRDRGQSGEYLPSIGSDLEKFNGSHIVNALGVLSKSVPTTYVQTLLPWMERVLSLRPPQSADWPTYGWDDLTSDWHEHVFAVQHTLLRTFANGLAMIAGEDEATFSEFADRLAQSPYPTPQMLLAHAYASVPERFASTALRFLQADRRRLLLGEHECYESRQLIAAIFPHLTSDERLELEAAIIAEGRVWPQYGRRGLRWRGQHSMYLLQALPRDELSPHVVRLLQELERKFPNLKASAVPIVGMGGMIGSPISSDAAERMSDTAWLSAMARYHGSVNHRIDPFRGGAQQLGQVLLDLVKRRPDRFFRLALRVPADCDAAYVDAFARGLAESDAPAEHVFAVVRHFMAHPDRNAKRQLTWAVQKRIAADLPGDLMALLESYLFDTTNDPDDNVGDPYSGYINSVRGSAFEALMHTLDLKGTQPAKQRMWELIAYAGNDALTMLRAGAIEQLLYRLHEDRDRAVQLFEQIVTGHAELLRSRYTQEFLYYGSYRHVSHMLPFMRQLLETEHEQSQERGAELVALAAISPSITSDTATRSAIDELAAMLPTGRITWRRGAAGIYAHNLILDKLPRFFNDEDESVRRAASRFLTELRFDRSDALAQVIQAYASSKSLFDVTSSITDYLWEYGINDTEWTLSLLEIAVDNPDQSQRYFFDGTEFVKLTLRIYTDTTDVDLRKRTMDVFDAMTLRFPHAASPMLDAWDRT